MGVVAHPIVVAQSAALMMVVVTAVASVPDKMRVLTGNVFVSRIVVVPFVELPMAAATVAVVAGVLQFCSNGQCLPIIIDPPVGGSDAGTTSGGMDAGTVGALDAGPSPLDTCTTDNYFHCGEGSDFLPGFGPCCIEGYCASCPEFCASGEGCSSISCSAGSKPCCKDGMCDCCDNCCGDIEGNASGHCSDTFGDGFNCCNGFCEEGPITFCALIIDPCYHGATDGTADGDAEGSSEGSTSGGSDFGNGSP